MSDFDFLPDDQPTGVPFSRIMKQSVPAVEAYRDRVEAKLAGEEVTPLSQEIDMLGVLREIQFGIYNIQKSQEEQEEDLRKTKRRLEAQEQYNADREKNVEKVLEELRAMSARFSPEEKARAEARFAQDVRMVATHSHIPTEAKTMTGKELLLTEKRKPVRWSLPEPRIFQIHDLNFFIMPNGNTYEVVDNNPCIVIDPKTKRIIKKLAGGVPVSVAQEVEHSLRSAGAKLARTNLASIDEDDSTGMGMNAKKLQNEMDKIDAKYGIKQADRDNLADRMDAIG